jgi:hypothetical protein
LLAEAALGFSTAAGLGLASAGLVAGFDAAAFGAAAGGRVGDDAGLESLERTVAVINMYSKGQPK